MALKSLDALAKAIAAVKKEAGNLDEHKALVQALAGVSEQLGSGAEAEASAKPERNSEDDDYSFETAEKRHVARSAEKAEAAPDGAASASGGEGA